MPRCLPELPSFAPRRALSIAALGLAATTLLAGCGMWPKSWSLPGLGGAGTQAPAEHTQAPPPEAVPEVIPAQAPAIVVPQPMAATPAPVPEPVNTERTLVAGVPVESMSPATRASLGVAAPSAPIAAPAAPATFSLKPPKELVPGYYLNVGLFANAANAANAQLKLEGASLPVFVDGVVSSKGPLTRVRVGPYAKKTQAQTAAKKVRALQLDAVVFRK